MSKRPVTELNFKPFGAALKAARVAHKKSRKQASEAFSISPRYLANIENVGQQPSLPLFFDMVKRYNISVDQFIGRKGGLATCKRSISRTAACGGGGAAAQLLLRRGISPEASGQEPPTATATSHAAFSRRARRRCSSATGRIGRYSIEITPEKRKNLRKPKFSEIFVANSLVLALIMRTPTPSQLPALPERAETTPTRRHSPVG